MVASMFKPWKWESEEKNVFRKYLGVEVKDLVNKLNLDKEWEQIFPRFMELFTEIDSKPEKKWA